MTDTPNVSLLDREPVGIREANTVAALRKIVEGLENTHSEPGKWMTRMSKRTVYRIARLALQAYDTGSRS